MVSESATRVEAAQATPLGPLAALESIIRPSSVVVIGANESLGKLTSGTVSNLLRHGYTGRLHVVNPNRDQVFGVPTLRSLDELPEVPDTAVIVLGARHVAATVDACAELGIRTATVVASGFGEGGARAGSDALESLTASLARTGIRILGPNTAGLLNINENYVPRASQNHPEKLIPGRVGIVTQSGGLCNTLLNRAQAHDVGVGLAVSTGNQLDLDLWDVGQYMLADDGIDVIVTITEGFGDPRKFVLFAEGAGRAGKPVLALKLGTSEAGRRAVETHSGSMAGASDVHRAVLRDLNVVQVDDLDELWEVASLFTSWRVPSTPLSRLGIITPSGGDGVIAADEASRLGLEVPEPARSTREAFAQVVPAGHPSNPFDTQAALAESPPETLTTQIELMARDADTDATLLALPVLATPFALSALGPHVQGIAEARPPRVAVSLWTAEGSTQDALEAVRAHGWPTFNGSVRAVRAIAHYGSYAAGTRRHSGRWTGVVAERPSTLLTYWEARRVLRQSGVPFNVAKIVYDVEDAMRVAEELGGPVTLKLSTSQFTHKADVGAVLPYLVDKGSIRHGAERLLSMLATRGDGEGLVVEDYVASVFPVFLGAHRDSEFGPILLVGLGGGFAEAYGDVARISCPAAPEQVHEALQRTKLVALLRKYPVAFDALVRLGAELSRRMALDPTWNSFDVNPLLVRADSSIVAVDARIQLS